MLLLVLMNLAYAILFPISKIALGYASPMFLIGFKMTLAGGGIMIYQYIFNREKFYLPKESYLPLFYAAFFSIYITNVFDFWGFKYLSATKSCFLYNLSPFVAALIARFYFKEYFSWKKWLGLAIVLAGALPMIIFDPGSEQIVHPFNTFLPLPEIALLIGIIASPLGWLLAQRYLCTIDYNAVTVNGITMLVGGLLALLQSFLLESWSPLPVSNWHYFLLSAFAIIFFSNIVGNTLYVRLLKDYSVTFLALTSFSEAIIVAILDWLILDIPITYKFWIAMSVVFVGLYLFYIEELNKDKISCKV